MGINLSSTKEAQDNYELVLDNKTKKKKFFNHDNYSATSSTSKDNRKLSQMDESTFLKTLNKQAVNSHSSNSKTMLTNSNSNYMEYSNLRSPNFVNSDKQEIELNKTYLSPKGSYSEESMKYMSELEKLLFYFSAGSNICGVRYLTINNIHINTLDEERTSSLHIACRSGSLQMVEEIINLGAMIDIPDLAGWTTLHIASFFKRSECILLLLKHNANLLTRNREGDCPFDLVYDDMKCIEVIGNFVRENHTFDNYFQDRIENVMLYEDFNTQTITEGSVKNKYFDKAVIENLYQVYNQKHKRQNASQDNINKISAESKDDNQNYKEKVYNVLDLKQKMADLYKIIPKKHTFYLEYDKSRKEEMEILKKLKNEHNHKDEKNDEKNNANSINTNNIQTKSNLNKQNNTELEKLEKPVKLTFTKTMNNFGGISERKELQLKGIVSKNLTTVKKSITELNSSNKKEYKHNSNLKIQTKNIIYTESNTNSNTNELFLKKRVRETTGYTSPNYQTEKGNSFNEKPNGLKIPNAFPETKNIMKVSNSNFQSQYFTNTDFKNYNADSFEEKHSLSKSIHISDLNKNLTKNNNLELVKALSTNLLNNKNKNKDDNNNTKEANSNNLNIKVELSNNIFIQEVLQEIKVKPSQSQTLLKVAKSSNNYKIKKVLPDGPILLEDSQMFNESFFREKKINKTNTNDIINKNTDKKSKILQNMIKDTNTNVNNCNNQLKLNTRSKIITSSKENEIIQDFDVKKTKNKHKKDLRLLTDNDSGFIQSSSEDGEDKVNYKHSIEDFSTPKKKSIHGSDVSCDAKEDSFDYSNNKKILKNKIDNTNNINNTNNTSSGLANFHTKFQPFGFLKNTRNYKMQNQLTENDTQDFSFFIDYENELNRVHKLNGKNKENYQNQSFFISENNKKDETDYNLYSKNMNNNKKFESGNITIMCDEAESFLLDEYAFNPNTYNIKEIIDLSHVSHDKVFVISETEYFLSNINLKEIFLKVFDLNISKLENLFMDLFTADCNLALLLLMSIFETGNTIAGIVKQFRSFNSEKLISMILFSEYDKNLFNFEKIGLNIVKEKEKQKGYMLSLNSKDSDGSEWKMLESAQYLENELFLMRMFEVRPFILSKRALIYNYFCSYSFESLEFKSIIRKILKTINLESSDNDILVKLDLISECLANALFNFSKSTKDTNLFSSDIVLYQFLFSVFAIDLEMQNSSRDKINKLTLDFMVIIKDLNNGKNLDNNMVKEYLNQIQLSGFLNLKKISNNNNINNNNINNINNNNYNNKEYQFTQVFISTNNKENSYLAYISNSFLLLFRVKQEYSNNTKKLKDIYKYLQIIDFKFESLQDIFLKENYVLDKFLYINRLFYDIITESNHDYRISSSSILIKSKLNKRNLLIFKNKVTFIKYTKNMQIEIIFESNEKKNKFIEQLIAT